MKRLVLAAVLLAGGCRGTPSTPAPSATSAPEGLEAAAIQAGVIADPASTDITGLYARDTDRVCIVPAVSAYRIGVFIDYGDDQRCGASGTVSRVGETMHVALGRGGACSFDARFEGDRIVFPGRVPAPCQQLCERRASLAALDVARLSDSGSEAATLRDARGRLLCSGSE